MDDFQPMQRINWNDRLKEHLARNKVKNTLGAAAGSATGTEGLVCDDIAARQKLGMAKYGTTVCANPLELKAWLQHAYEECLDQAVYLRRAIQELDK